MGYKRRPTSVPKPDTEYDARAWANNSFFALIIIIAIALWCDPPWSAVFTIAAGAHAVVLVIAAAIATWKLEARWRRAALTEETMQSLDS
jgi:uncharacterized membrane protein YqjE